MNETNPDSASLLDVLVDGFEKNEVLGGSHMRVLPLRTEAMAALKFSEFVEEVSGWRGSPSRMFDRQGRRLAAWDDLELRQAGCGVMVRVRAPWFSRWWNDRDLWKANPMGPIYDWLAEDERE